MTSGCSTFSCRQNPSPARLFAVYKVLGSRVLLRTTARRIRVEESSSRHGTLTTFASSSQNCELVLELGGGGLWGIKAVSRKTSTWTQDRQYQTSTPRQSGTLSCADPTYLKQFTAFAKSEAERMNSSWCKVISERVGRRFLFTAENSQEHVDLTEKERGILRAAWRGSLTHVRLKGGLSTSVGQPNSWACHLQSQALLSCVLSVRHAHGEVHTCVDEASVLPLATHMGGTVVYGVDRDSLHDSSRCDSISGTIMDSQWDSSSWQAEEVLPREDSFNIHIRCVTSLDGSATTKFDAVDLHDFTARLCNCYHPNHTREIYNARLRGSQESQSHESESQEPEPREPSSPAALFNTLAAEIPPSARWPITPKLYICDSENECSHITLIDRRFWAPKQTSIDSGVTALAL